jgi:hypothetical protein
LDVLFWLNADETFPPQAEAEPARDENEKFSKSTADEWQGDFLFRLLP